MFTLIEGAAEVRRAQRQLEASVHRDFHRIEPRNIGWRGGREKQAKLRTDGSYWFWSAENRKDANPRRHNWFGKLGPGTGASIAVQIDVPPSGRSNVFGGFFARDVSTGREYLFHAGRVGGGRKGVMRGGFELHAGFKPHLIYQEDGTAKEGFLVMPLTGDNATGPARTYVQAVIDYKAAVQGGVADYLGRSEVNPEDEALGDYFDEFSGRKTGQAPARTLDYVSRHGDIVRALRKWRVARGLTRGSRIVKTRLLDLGVGTDQTLTEVFEVKTSGSRSDLYTAIGQLMVHGRSVDCARTLVMPANEPLPDVLKTALRRIGVSLLLYRLGKTDVAIL